MSAGAIASASDDAGWCWVDGALVYTQKGRWVRVPPQDLGGALRKEIFDDFRHAARFGRDRAPRWRNLRDEIEEEFAEYGERQHEVTIGLEVMAANRREALRQFAVEWRATHPHQVKASAKRRYAVKKKADRVDGRWVCTCRHCGVLFCPVRTRAVQHCSDACRKQFGHAAADAKLAVKLGTDPVSARRVKRCQDRRSKGIGPRERSPVPLRQRVGWWLLLSEAALKLPSGKVRRGCLCRCRCGRQQVVALSRLLAQQTQSCKGCRFKRERDAAA